MQKTLLSLLMLSIMFTYQNCGQIDESNASRVQIRMPDQLPSSKITSSSAERKGGLFFAAAENGALADIWISNVEPLSTSELNCFGVVIGSNEADGVNGNRCVVSSNGNSVQFGENKMGALPGESIEFEIEPGNHTIGIIGWRAASQQACLSLRGGPINVANLSHPFLIGQVTQDLQPGDERVSVSASITGAKKLRGCSNLLQSDGSVLAINQHFAGGSIIGLKGPVGTPMLLQLNAEGLEEPVIADVHKVDVGEEVGTFDETPLFNGTPFNLTIIQQPSAHTCTISNGSGIINGANNTDAVVNCVGTGVTVGGNVTGLTGGPLRLTKIVFPDFQEGPGGEGQEVESPGGPGSSPGEGPEQEVLEIAGNGSYTFNGLVEAGENVVIFVGENDQPPGQVCFVDRPPLIGSENITDINVTCEERQFFVSGTVTGLASSAGSINIDLNGGQEIIGTVQDGFFGFSTTLPQGASYNVTAFDNGQGEIPVTCTVDNGSGVIDNENVSNIFISCEPAEEEVPLFTVGGTVDGLEFGGAVDITLNGVETLSLSANSGFTFSTALPDGAAVDVAVVVTDPSGGEGGVIECSVELSDETIQGANMTDVDVSCQTIFF